MEQAIHPKDVWGWAGLPAAGKKTNLWDYE
jgi:hypothetical protein